jgi:hypothetical protein
MKSILILTTLTILLASVFTNTNTNSNSASNDNAQISSEFFNGYFQYLKGETYRFNNKCFSDNLNKEYEKLSQVITSKWLDLGDFLRVMSQIESSVSAVCDFPELKEFNEKYTKEVNSGNYMRMIAFRAIQCAQIIKDLYDSAYRTDPQHIGTTMAKISNYLVYLDEKNLKFLD